MSTKNIEKCYLYGYPIVGMYKLLTDQVLGTGEGSGFHCFAHMAKLSTPETSFIPAPNNDTTYSRAWLDLTGSPVVIEAPDTDDRYYSIQFLDMYSETITNVGRRTTGTKAKRFIIIGPEYNDLLPEDDMVIRSSTPFALAFLRILIRDRQDLDNVKQLQQKFTISYLTRQGDSRKTENTLPPCCIRDDKEFFATLSRILSMLPLPEDQLNYFVQAKEFSSMSPEELSPECDKTRKLMEEEGKNFGEAVNNWRIAAKGVGTYGADYLQRAVVWHKGALANCPEESLYPSTFQDGSGELLDGRSQYTLTFPAEGLPPVSQFWSLTMYRFRDAFLAANSIDRYSVGDRTRNLYYAPDGSLTIYISHKEPASPEEKANWLPAPPEGFYMTLRMYGPDPSAAEGSWAPPAVMKICELRGRHEN